MRSLELANHVRLTDGLSLAQQSQRTLLTASLVRRNRLLLLAIHHHRRGAVLAVGGRHGMRPSGDDVVSEKKKLQSATVCGERLQVRTRRRQCLKEVRANGRLVSAALVPFLPFPLSFPLRSSLFRLPSPSLTALLSLPQDPDSWASRRALYTVTAMLGGVVENCRPGIEPSI